MMNYAKQPGNNPIGFHYFQDTLHYSSQDLSTWLPELKRLKAAWVVLLSEAERAIPEQFITGLIEAQIEPVIHFKLKLPESPSAEDLRPIFSSYARWGVRYVVLFDTPNQSSSWSSAGWSHQDLVERFIDRFLPLASEALRQGLIPVFPPLMPGGSYWDTSFFKSSLQSIQRRGNKELLQKMAVASFAYTFGHELAWGDGGPEKWNQVRPYLTPEGSEDQRGFNNRVWMRSIAAALGIRDLPIFLFGAGVKTPDAFYSPEVHAEIVQAMLERIYQQETDEPVLSINFWLLAAEADSESSTQAWINSEGIEIPAFRILSGGAQKVVTPVTDRPIPRYVPQDFPEPAQKSDVSVEERPIAHYLLLPLYDWGVADWHLEVIRPFMRKHHPTVGFSISEAALAKKVTVVGGDKDFATNAIIQLRNSGCIVDQISGDGTSIATQLLER